ncbi:MAG: hypothetical protein WAM91_12280 [Candidatus Acidiferrales bacterium]
MPDPKRRFQMRSNRPDKIRQSLQLNDGRHTTPKAKPDQVPAEMKPNRKPHALRFALRIRCWRKGSKSASQSVEPTVVFAQSMQEFEANPSPNLARRFACKGICSPGQVFIVFDG